MTDKQKKIAMKRRRLSAVRAVERSFPRREIYPDSNM